MLITIGVPTYNGAWRLRNLLKSISMRTPEVASGEARVVVVDDGSPLPDQIRSFVEDARASMPVDFIRHDSNRGISAGWNTATRLHPSKYVVLVNDDVIVSKGWIRALTYVLEHSPEVGGVGLNYHTFTADDVVPLLAGPDSDHDVVPRSVDSLRRPAPERREYITHAPGRVMCPSGQLFAFRREDFDRIGGFDEAYKSFYEESCFGTSMAATCRKIGVQINWPNCWHMWGKTFEENPDLQASTRMSESRTRYRAKWNVPEGIHEFEYTNPKYLGTIPPVSVKFLRGPDGHPDEVTL